MTRSNTESAGARGDIYTRITNLIVAQLEQGVRPWHQPWSAGHAAGRITRPLRANGVPYQGINVIMLWSQAVAAGYSAPIWMTFKQALELGGHVRKGEKSTPVVYANKIIRTEIDAETGDEEDRAIPYLKAYSAFNVEQIEGLPDHYYAQPPARIDPVERIAQADAFFANTGAVIRHGGGKAYYMIGEDRIQMPPFEAFESAEAYYATLGHECAHWTRHPSRLAREFGRKRWGDEGYAMEECVAEIAASYLCADLGLTPVTAPRDEHASYIAHWLGVMKADPRAIFSAAAHAQRAADFLNGLQPVPASVAA